MKGKQQPEPLRRAAGYVRISALMGREQGNDLLSDKIQREKIEAWASYRGYRIVEWYIDIDVSGRAGVRRPQFERLLADARGHRFDAVAVYRLTRFARSVRGAAVALDELEKLNVGLVSVTEDIDTLTAGGKFMRNILFAMAEFESERISEEWRNVHANRRRRGLHNITKEVTGYRRGESGLLEVEPVEAQAIRKMYAMRAAGASYGSIAQALQMEGYTSRTGKSRFGHATIGQILYNPIYAGLLNADGDLVPAQHDAIVPRDLWEKVQTLSGTHSRTNRYRGSLLSGLLVCSACGYRMAYQAEYERTSGYMQPANYRCAARQRSEPCDAWVSIQASLAEDYVEEAFLNRFRARRMPHGGRLKATRQQREWATRLGRLRGRLDELDRALDKLADQRFVKGSIKSIEYDRQAGRFIAERTDVEDQARDLERMIETVRPLERDALEVWPQATTAGKRSALRIAIAEIRVMPAVRKGRGQGQFVKERLQIAWLQ